MLFLLVACAGPSEESGSVAPTSCTEAPTEVNTLAGWFEPSASGLSLEDALGFAVGTFSGVSLWDDGTTTPFTLAIEPQGAEERVYGDPEQCSVMVEGAAAWSLTTENGRVALAGDTSWEVEVGAARGTPQILILDPPITFDAVDLDPLAPTSTLQLRTSVRADGTVTFVIREDWLLDERTMRQCVRAGYEEGQVLCQDVEVWEGAE